MNRKPKKKVSNIMLVIVCIMILLYTIASFILQYYTGVEVSATLTSAWFAFWGCELFNLMFIKTSKLKYNQVVIEAVSEDEDSEPVG